MKKMIVAGICVIGALALTGCGGKKIEPINWLSVEFSGADGYGTATIDESYDWMEELGLDEDKTEDLAKTMVMEEAIDYEVSPETDLSNGDEVTLTVRVDEDRLKKMGYRAKSSSKKIKVSGLPEVQELKLEDYITVNYDGASPYADAKISVKLPVQGMMIRYDYGDHDEVANGDTLTVTAEYDKEEMAKLGYKLKSDTAKIKVSGLPTYMDSIDQMTEENLQAMEKDVQEDIADHFSTGIKTCWLMAAATGDHNVWEAGFSNPTVTYTNEGISDIYLLNSNKYQYPLFTDQNAMLCVVYKVNVDYSIKEYYVEDQAGSTTIYVPYIIYSPIVDGKSGYTYEQGNAEYSSFCVSDNREEVLTKLKDGRESDYRFSEKNY